MPCRRSSPRKSSTNTGSTAPEDTWCRTASERSTAGVPVVATRAGALPETLGSAALFVDPGDVDALVGALDRALTDEALRTRLVAAGHARAEAFSWDATADAVAGVYAQLC